MSRWLRRGFLFVLAVGLVSCASRLEAAAARKWTDTQGRQIQAEFVRVFQGDVVLKRGPQVVRVPFFNLSDEDRDWIRKTLEAKGKGDLVPTAPPLSPETQANPPAQRQPGAMPPGMMPVGGGMMPGMSSPMMPGSSAPTMPAGGGMMPGMSSPMMPGSSAPTMPVGGGMMPGMSSPMMPGSSAPTMPVGGGMMPGTSSPMMPSTSSPPGAADPSGMGPPNMGLPSAGPPRASMPDVLPSMATGPMFVEEKQCTKCKKVVPSTSKAGDRCPHCGIVWDFEKLDNNLYRDKEGKVSGTPPVVRYSGLGALGGAIIAVIVAVLRAFRGRN